MSPARMASGEAMARGWCWHCGQPGVNILHPTMDAFVHLTAAAGEACRSALAKRVAGIFPTREGEAGLAFEGLGECPRCRQVLDLDAAGNLPPHRARGGVLPSDCPITTPKQLQAVQPEASP